MFDLTADELFWDPRRARRRYLTATLACALFAAIYESFSHEVYSPFMVGAFGFPLVLGVCATTVALRTGTRVGRRTASLLACGVLTLTFASLLTGVFEIYGTTSPYTPAYWVLGVALVVAAVADSAATTFLSR